MDMPIPVNLFVQELVEHPSVFLGFRSFLRKVISKSVKIFANKYRWNQHENENLEYFENVKDLGIQFRELKKNHCVDQGNQMINE